MKVGVLGAGTMGAVHLAAYANIPNVEVVGVVDARPEAAAAGAELIGATPYASYDELMVAEDPDLIDICLPTHYHRDAAVRAAQEGKDVVLEKPITRYLGGARQIIDAFSESEGRLFVAHVVRFLPEYLQLKEMIDGGQFGQVSVIRTSRKTPFLSSWNDWYASWQASGSSIVDMLIHDFDFLRWAFGDVDRVYAKSTYGREFNRMDYALVTLRFSNGPIAHVEGHWGYPEPFCYTVEIAGTETLATIDSTKHSSFKLVTGSLGSGDGEIPQSQFGKNPYQLELEHFIHCAQTREEPVVTGTDAYEALKISLAAMESVATGKPINPKTYEESHAH